MRLGSPPFYSIEGVFLKTNPNTFRPAVGDVPKPSGSASIQNLPNRVSSNQAKNNPLFNGSYRADVHTVKAQSLSKPDISLPGPAGEAKVGEDVKQFAGNRGFVSQKIEYFNQISSAAPTLTPLNEKQVVVSNTIAGNQWVNDDFAPIYLIPPDALTDADFKPNIVVKGWQDPGGPPRAGLSAKNQAIVDFIQDAFTTKTTTIKLDRRDGTGKVDVEVSSKVFERPDPKIYLTEAKIERHLNQFRDQPTFFLLESVHDNWCKDGIGRPDGQFLLTKEDGDRIQEKLSNRSTFSEGMAELGLTPTAWVGKRIMRVTVKDIPSLRMASGNEQGANKYWIPGGYLPGGLPEAVCDRLPHEKVTKNLLPLIS